MKVIFHEDFFHVYASDPAAAKGRMESVTDVIGSAVEYVVPEPAAVVDIEAVHSSSHIDWVRQQGVYEIAALAAGGAIQAAEMGLQEPCFALIRPPGHHASSDSAWGFCYFNNVAIALRRLRRQERIRTAYVLDIDLHFGDGTANILRQDAWVTVHNVAANRREDYLREVREAMGDCEADVVAVSAGFDNHEEDWGGTLTTQDYSEIGGMVREAAIRNAGGCFAVLEGGYNHEVLGRNVMAMIQGLSKVP
jgi:acetoin utilization deacetylase AcuC-like enzyme